MLVKLYAHGIQMAWYSFCFHRDKRQVTIFVPGARVLLFKVYSQR